MKHIQPYQIFENNQKPQHLGFPETEEEIHQVCRVYQIHNYSINDDLSLNVEGDVILNYKKIIYLPLNFNYVSGDFYCQNINLTTLEGAPKTINGYFGCDGNKLTSLKRSPQTVGGGFDCGSNNLTSLEGGPNTVGGDFYCYNNELTTLKGSPHTVGGCFGCYSNQLTSLEYLPSGIDYTDEYTQFDNNPIYTLINTFIKHERVEDLIQEFNEYSIVRGDTVVLGRLETFVSDFNLVMPYLDEVEEYYKIV